MREGKWREATTICRRILSNRATFEVEEINYKLEISKRIKALFAALEEGEDSAPLLKRVFAHPNNLTSFYAHGPFIEWATEHQDDSYRALRVLVDTNHTVANRINRFLELSTSNLTLKLRGS